MTRRRVVVTHNFAANLQQLERFLDEAGASHRYDRLIIELLDRVVPQLEKTPLLGRPLDPRRLVYDADLLRAIEDRLGSHETRLLVWGDFIVLYLVTAKVVHLLAIKHHREAGFRLGRT